MNNTTVEFFRKHIKTPGGVERFIQHLMQNGQQNVHTPFSLCREMVGKLSEYTTVSDKKIVVLLNTEFLHVLITDFGGIPENITMIVDNPVDFEFCKLQYGMKPGINLFEIDINKTVQTGILHTNRKGNDMKYDWQDMKFDCVVMNPPYQAPRINKKKGVVAGGSFLWDKFVQPAIGLTKENGYICAVHPPSWRHGNTKRLRQLHKVMTSLQMQYLELHSVNDGQKVFGASTPYDWYVMQNHLNTKATTIKDYDGQIHQINLKDWSFLPNSQFDLVKKIFAKDGEERCEILNSYSYPTNIPQPWMSKTQNVDFQYPCIRYIPRDVNALPQLWYSNTNKRGHFGVPKVVFHPKSNHLIVDITGQYGMTQFAYGVVDTPKNLSKIKQAMESEKFLDFCKAFRVGNADMYDGKYIALFRKDFWKEFI